MGKRNLQKYKKAIEAIEKSNDEESSIDPSSLKDLQTILNELNNSNLEVREHITNVLSSYQFRENDKEMLAIVTQPAFLRPLVGLLNDNFYQIKYNAIASMINLIVSFSESDLETILLNQTDFIELSVKLIKDFIYFDKKSVEHIKVVRTVLNLFDLFMLIFDLYNEETDSKVNFEKVMNEIISMILTQKELLSEDVYISCNLVLGNYFSTKIVLLSNENTNLKQYIELANTVINDENNKNEYLKNILAYNLFYLSCANSSFLKQNNISLLPKVIERIYTVISNESSFMNSLNTLNVEVMKLANNKMDTDEKENDSLKEKIKSTDKSVNSTLLCMKVFEDIIESINIENSDNNNQTINEDEFEEIDDDDQMIEEANDKLDEMISSSVNEVISIDNYSPLKKMLSDSFLVSLSKYCDLNKQDNQFLVQDTDKLITIKENIEEIEYISLSMINNLILKIPSLFNQQFTSSLFSFLTEKIKKYEHKNEMLSLFGLTFRNLVTKYNYIKNISEEQYQILYNISINTKDSFVKGNMIDIISTLAARDKKYIIGKSFKDLLTSENNIEIVAHLSNAFMDIFSEDDLESNKFLKELGIVSMMKEGVNEFKNRMKSAKKSKLIDKEGYDYIKETLMNMKRFVKYKEDSFAKLNI